MCGSQALGQIDALRAQQVRQPRRRRMQITRLWASCALLMGSKAAGAAAGAASGTASTWQHPVAGGRWPVAAWLSYLDQGRTRESFGRAAIARLHSDV